jgi:hypothetical protein
LFLAAAIFQAAPIAPPTTVSPLTVTAQPKTPPPADAKVTIDSGDEATGSQRVTLYPSHGWVRGVGGRVTLTCLISAHGLAEHCRVAYEQPQGHGFGAAALAQQALLRIPPKRGPDGEPVAAEMNIALEFKPPVKDDNIGDLERSCLGCSELPGDRIQISHNPLSTRHMVMMNHPAWVAVPTFEDLAAAYPPGAGRAEGYAVVHCEVLRSTGVLTRCFTAKQDPATLGFGMAALRLAAKFRVSPRDLAYAPHDGPVEVDIPIRFAPPSESAERWIIAPNWLIGIDPDQVPKVFPPEATAQGLTTGRGVARCVVGPDGGLTKCATRPGDPEGLGFSEAAVKLASNLRMNLWSADATPVQGGVIEVPIRLYLAGPK